MSNDEFAPAALAVDVVERGTKERKGWVRCEIDREVRFNVSALESYFLLDWDERIYDALLVAAAVEFCDRSRHRPISCWGRSIDLRIAVHDVGHWQGQAVHQSLCDALNFLTGDIWRISFTARRKKMISPRQEFIKLEFNAEAVIPFSDGMDSRAVAGLMGKQLGDKLLRVRLGSMKFENGNHPSFCGHFKAVPFSVKEGDNNFVESSVRSRGFKFSLISGLAASLAKAKRCIVPESGQGAMGPSLLPVGPVYPDYRNHPRFTVLMERFIRALLGYDLKYEFPRIWHTKGETLREYIQECEDARETWTLTSSCWMDSRLAGVAGKKRQCGICAACLLRRMSIHAAGQSEPAPRYLWENLSADSFSSGVCAAYDPKKVTKGKREYAIAGVLHLDHLATIRHSPTGALIISSEAFHLAEASGMTEAEVGEKLHRLLQQHETEWDGFLRSIGTRSFIHEWVSEAS